MLTLTLPVIPTPPPSDNYVSTVYVVTWSPDSMGGFEWRRDRADAEEFRQYIQDPTAEIHTVAVPDEVAQAAAATQAGWPITDWLDYEGWSDGIDPRPFDKED